MPGRSISAVLNRKGWQFVVLALAAALGAWLPAHVGVSVSASLRHRVFFLGAPDDIAQGDYVMFRERDASLDKYIVVRENNGLLVKKIACTPGQELTTYNGMYYCDGEYLGYALDHDSKGNKLPRFIFNGTIPDKKYFVIGENIRSYDSKYMGFVDEEDIRYKAYPIW